MEKKTYRVTFMADLTEDDVRAMKKCFYDAMLESMEISPVWNLKLEEIKDEPEPNPDTDRTANDYILNVGQTQDELTPFAYAFTQEDAIELAKEAGQHWKCVEVVYMPVDNDDINEIVWSQYKK
jgi:hypothetical protein